MALKQGEEISLIDYNAFIQFSKLDEQALDSGILILATIEHPRFKKGDCRG